LSNLMDRMKAAEIKQAADYEGLVIASAANATAIINMQHIFSQKVLGV